MSDLIFNVMSANGESLALIVKANYKSVGIEFLTPDTFGQQVAYWMTTSRQLASSDWYGWSALQKSSTF